MFRVLRAFLRESAWPPSLSLAVLSAKFGLIGGLAQIPYYNRRMTALRAERLSASVTASFQKIVPNHETVDLVMGKDYLDSIDLQAARAQGANFRFAEGGIGTKLNRLHDLLRRMPHQPRRIRKNVERTSRPLYFLPDWDDFLDVKYNFQNDSFSSLDRATRTEEHSIALMRPHRMCDGVLVSLAQHLGSKGLLKRIGHTDNASLAPSSVRAHFKLQDDQWAFGDCGAFSYVNEDLPTISIEQAISLYSLYDFDYGASVDHIPVDEIEQNGRKHTLTEAEKKSRVRLTRRNAERFFARHREEGADFIPVGVVQGLDAKDYARQIGDYLDIGYTHLALGGLVPRSDGEVKEIVRKVNEQTKFLRRPPWIHLLGIYRPSLQEDFRRFGINSFDSATYFRKAWLRSDQNYLACDGKWYAAIRVPPTRDGRTMLRLKASGVSERRIKNLEQKALAALRNYDQGIISVSQCLKVLMAYDSLLTRAADEQTDLREAYRETLEAKPWQSCKCSMCSSIGIDVLIFRGFNRNKRRGAHNTLQLFQQLNTSQRKQE